MASRAPLALSETEHPSFSRRNEVQYFFCKGIPLVLAAFLNWGVPPLVAMLLAGHAANSARLQASLGYGRVWYNCTCQMIMSANLAYMSGVIPGCIGAGRTDRIPRYLQRSVLMIIGVMLPFLALQFAAGTLMKGFGVPEANAEDVGVYCRMMIISCLLNLTNSHLEIICINLGYARCSTLISLTSGLGVHVFCTYWFILRWGMGVEGAALGQIVVESARLLLWNLVLIYFRLFGLVYVAPPGAERCVSMTEARIFASQAGPSLLSNLAGWFIFELQMMAMANIAGISQEALAAGAIWVQFEGALASTQDGWLRTTSMRSLVLLGKRDPGGRQAFFIFNRLAFLVVAACNVFLFAFQDRLCAIVSKEIAVQRWFRDLAWVLLVHTQTRIAALNGLFLFIPLGRGRLRVLSTFVCFYCVAAPLAGCVALTDWVADLRVKMVACVGATSVAQLFQAAYVSSFLHRLDWDEAGAIIQRRANTDRSGCSEETELRDAEGPSTNGDR